MGLIPASDAFKGVSAKHKAQMLLLAAKHRLPIGDPEAVLAKLHQFSPSEASLVLEVFDEDLSPDIRRTFVEHPLFEQFMAKTLLLCAERERIDKTAALAQLLLGVETCGVTLPLSVRTHMPNEVAYEDGHLVIVTPRSGKRDRINTAGMRPEALARVRSLVSAPAPASETEPAVNWRALAGL